MQAGLADVFNVPNPMGKKGTTFYFKNLTPDNRTSEISALQIPFNLLINLIPLLGFDAQPYSTISFFGTNYWISVPFFLFGLVEKKECASPV